MKKFLSIFLAVAFVFAAMCLSVSAETQSAVGTYKGTGEDASISDGVGSIETDATGKNPNIQNITVNFTPSSSDGTSSGTTIVNRYAVDIEYGDLILDLTNLKLESGDGESKKTYYMVWDVNNYEYVLCTATTDANGNITGYTPVGSDDSELNENSKNSLLTSAYEVNSVQVINHSDLPIDTEVKIESNNSDDYRISWTVVDDDSNNEGESVTSIKATVDKATAKTSTDGAGSAKRGATYTFKAVPATQGGAQYTWLDVIDYLHNEADANGTTVVAKVTVTISSASTSSSN